MVIQTLINNLNNYMIENEILRLALRKACANNDENMRTLFYDAKRELSDTEHYMYGNIEVRQNINTKVIKVIKHSTEDLCLIKNDRVLSTNELERLAKAFYGSADNEDEFTKYKNEILVKNAEKKMKEVVDSFDALIEDLKDSSKFTANEYLGKYKKVDIALEPEIIEIPIKF